MSEVRGWGSLPGDVETTIPLRRLVNVEMRKMLDTRAGLWLVIVIVVLTTAATVLTAVFGPEDGTPMEYLLLAAAGPQGLLLPVLGVLLVTGEWGQRAAMTTFTLVPRRGRIVVAKVVAALAIGLGVLLVTFAVAALATVLSGASVSDLPDNTPGHFTLLQVIGILQGLAFGLLLLNSAAAIVAYFLLPILSTIVFSVVEPLQDLRDWFDLNSATGPLGESASLSGEEWAHVTTATLVWVALPMALGTWRMLNAEVK